MSAVQTGPAQTDTSEMLVVHSVFRRGLRLAGGLVRRVEPGDTRRAGVVAAHLDLVEALLHHHPTAEDELLWPQLLERVPGELAPGRGRPRGDHDDARPGPAAGAASRAAPGPARLPQARAGGARHRDAVTP